MTRTNIPFIFIVIALSLISCNDEITLPPSTLDPVPEGTVAYFNIQVGDTQYNLIEGVDESGFYNTIGAPVNPQAGSTRAFGSLVTSDTSLLVFRVSYTRSSRNRFDLLDEITKTDGDLAFGERLDDEWVERRTGFFVDIFELEAPHIHGDVFSSWSTAQPDSAFISINESYDTGLENFIWLKGEFQVNIDRNGETIPVGGDFLMEFPFCCFE